MQRYVTRWSGKFVVDERAIAVLQFTQVPDWHYRSLMRDVRVSTLLASWAWDALEFA